MSLQDTPTGFGSHFSIQGLSTSESRAKIDNEISRLRTQIQHLCDLRNTLSPVSNLPEELLSRIFRHCRIEDPIQVHHFGKTRLHLSWVSRRWRAVALSDPVLWSFINYPGLDPLHSNDMVAKDYSSACIARSGDVHLTLRLETPSEYLLEFYFQHLHRIRDIDIDISRGLSYAYSQYWKRPAPNLVSLSLRRYTFDSASEHQPSPLGIFGGVFPKLHHLTLRECQFGPDLPLLSASELRTLHILDPTTHPLTFTPTHQIELPRLEKLTIDGNMNQTISFLTLFHSPASINIRIKERMVTEEDFREKMHFIQEHLKAIRFWGDDGVDSLSITCLMNDTFDLIASRSGDNPSRENQLHVYGYADWFGTFPYDWTSCAFEYLPLNKVQNVTLGNSSINSISELSRIASPKVLTLSSRQLDGEQGNPFSPLTAPDLFSSVEELKVNSDVYANFGEFQEWLVDLPANHPRFWGMNQDQF